jgi:hypothetical protein
MNLRAMSRVSFPSSGLGMPTFKLCLMFNFINKRINLFYSLTHQAELGYRHSQTGVWEREISRVDMDIYGLV